MAVTIKEVSARCGLSVSTVSKALNNYSDVSEATRKLVIQTAQEMGYHPNSLARALKTNRTYNLVVLFVDDNKSGLTHSYFAAVLDSFKSEAERLGYDITFINHNIGRNNMTYLEHCRYRNVDGVCLACVDFFTPEVIELIASDLPIVTIDHIFNNRTCILSDNVNGMKSLVRYVYDHGHRRIAFVHGMRSAVTESRVTGFYRTMRELNLSTPPEYSVECAYHNPTSASKAVAKILQLPQKPSCILMSDDYAALGGIEAIRAAGLLIPDDISIAGYDGIQLMQLTQPKLTTIQQNTGRIGTEAALSLIERIENPQTAGSDIVVVEGKLLPGETVRSIEAGEN
jgi:DNA-binding LacI/PurR family transcriptional regulator